MVREQNIDITHFEEDLDAFKVAFAKNYNSASTNFGKAIDEIDKAIKRMEEVKKFLTTSENQLRLANNKLEDVSVKKLTRKNPTMKAKFEALKGVRKKIMFYSSKNKVLQLDQKNMDYVTFGKGKKSLVIIPGLGDGLQTVKGMAQMLALTYREFAKVYKVYVFSRINKLPENYTTRNMAADVAEAMDVLNLKVLSSWGFPKVV